MSLFLQPLYLSCVRQFQTASDDSGFKSGCTDAANAVLDELSNYAKLTTALPHVDDVKAEISDLDEKHSEIFMDGLVYHLILKGYKHIRGDEAYVSAANEWEDSKGAFLQLMMESDQAVQDDDGIPTGDIVGLGYIEDE